MQNSTVHRPNKFMSDLGKNIKGPYNLFLVRNASAKINKDPDAISPIAEKSQSQTPISRYNDKKDSTSKFSPSYYK